MSVIVLPHRRRRRRRRRLPRRVRLGRALRPVRRHHHAGRPRPPRRPPVRLAIRIRRVRMHDAYCTPSRSLARATSAVETFAYDNAIVRDFIVATAGLGRRRLPGRPDRGAEAGAARTSSAHRRAVVRPAAPAAHQRGHLRVRRQRHLRRRLLLAAAAVQGAHVQRPAERAPLLGLAADHRRRRRSRCRSASRQQGIRRARVADRHRDHRRLGGVRRQLARHDRASAASGTSTSRSGSTSRRSSRSRCCTSSTRSSCRSACSRATRSTPACRTRSCSGGTATTRSRSS